MLLQKSVCRLHTPLIRFKYAITKNGGKVFQYPSLLKMSDVKQSTSLPSVVLYGSFDELPAHLRPHQYSEEEIETILMGGAAPYIPKSMQKKQKK